VIISKLQQQCDMSSVETSNTQLPQVLLTKPGNTAATDIAYNPLPYLYRLWGSCHDISALPLNASIHDGSPAIFSDDTTDVFQMIHSSNQMHWQAPADTKLTIRGKSVHDCCGLTVETLHHRSVPYRQLNDTVF
jgi:hypothetical protein